MPFNGTGTWVRAFNWVNDAANGILITASRVDSDSNDFASGLSNCITRDGQGKPTAAQNWNGQNLANVGNLTTTGQVGIGGAPAAGVPLQVTYAGAYLSLNTTTAGYSTVFGSDNGVQRWAIGQGGYAGVDGMSFYTGSAQTERARIDANGNFLIGSTSPVYGGAGRGLLEVNGATQALYGFKVNGLGVANLFHDGTTLNLTNSVSGSITLGTNAITRVMVDSVGRLSGGFLHNNSTLPTGTTNQYIASGTYTPTLTNVANFAGITANACQWLRVGNVVTVSGQFTASAAASVQCLMGISLPIPSALSGGLSNAAGSFVKGALAGLSGSILADTSNVRAQGAITNDGNTGGTGWIFNFTYVVN